MVQVGPPADPVSTLVAPPAVAGPAEHPEQARGTRRRRYTVEVPIDPEYLPFLGLMFLALVLRLWDLGAKALHHDESLHAFYAWRLYDGQGYQHDPMMHGPLLFLLNALTYLLLGASDFTARLIPALFGVALVGLPFLLRRELGRSGALTAAAIFTISPAYLYFSRFIRHDIYVDVFTLLLVAGVFRYLATGERSWFYTAVVAAALLFATKEDFYISGFIPFVFLVGAWFLLPDGSRQEYRARVRALGWESWVTGLIVFLAINILLYTTFFTNLRGICTAVVSLPLDGCAGAKGALNYWLDQQDYARGGQPWFYYAMLLPLYEFVPLGLGVLSVFLVRPRQMFFWFCVTWFVLALSIYSWAGEKMPWMLPQITLPLVLLSGRLLGQWMDVGWRVRAVSPRGLATGGLVLVAAFALLAWLGLGAAPAGSPVLQQSITLQRLALSVLIASIAGALFYLAPRWGRDIVVPGVTLGVLAIVGAAYLRVALMITYDHPDTPSEPLIYVQSSHDVVWIREEIDRIAAQTGQGKDLRMLLDNGWGDGDHEAVSWPFEWYLRDYHNRRYFTKTIDPGLNLAEYPVLIARSTNLDPIQNELNQYIGQKYRLNWWFPEDYKQYASDGPGLTIGTRRLGLPGLRLDLMRQTLADPDNRLKLLKFLIYRQAPGDMGAREMYFYVHREIPALGPAPLGGVAAAPPPAAMPAPAIREANAQTLADGTTIYGRGVDGRPVLDDPKGAAFGPAGRLYVVEGKAARVVVFNSDGSIATSWGTPGSGDGQFQEPWGIAVAPSGDVYIADTWNHRIQHFDANGTFLGKWGRLGDIRGSTTTDPGVFWGPRSIAISRQGELFVTDTGNKRVQVFSLDGTFLRVFGGDGSQPGQFREQVGIAVDSDGNLWLADTWNRRVQKLDPNGQPLGQFSIGSGWDSQTITNKPYLAVDHHGRIVATFPDQSRYAVFGPDGQQVSQGQVPGNGMPVGVTIAPDGRIVLADARNNVVDALPAP